MREHAHAKSQFIEIVDAGIDLGSLQRPDVGSLQTALQAQFFLGPAEYGANRPQIGRQKDSRRGPGSFLGRSRGWCCSDLATSTPKSGNYAM